MAGESAAFCAASAAAAAQMITRAAQTFFPVPQFIPVPPSTLSGRPALLIHPGRESPVRWGHVPRNQRGLFGPLRLASSESRHTSSTPSGDGRPWTLSASTHSLICRALTRQAAATAVAACIPEVPAHRAQAGEAEDRVDLKINTSLVSTVILVLCFCIIPAVQSTGGRAPPPYSCVD